MQFEKLKSQDIALIIPDFDFGGEEKRVVFFANNYINFFRKVYVIAPNGDSDQLLHPKVIRIKKSCKKITNLPTILLTIKKLELDFLQGHKRATLPILLASQKFFRIHAFFNFDNIYLNYNRLYSYITPSNIVYLSHEVESFYSKFYKRKKQLTINMGGDFYSTFSLEKKLQLRRDFQIEEGKFIILSLGRLYPQKNHSLLLNSLKKAKLKNFICLIVGTGPLLEELVSLTQELGLTDSIRFLGHRKDIEQLLNVSDLLVQSSIFEGFPNVFIEAASVGLPIVSTDVGSCRTLVRDNGLLVKTGDIEELAKAIVTVNSKIEHFRTNAALFNKSVEFKIFNKNEMLNNYLLYLNTQQN